MQMIIGVTDAIDAIDVDVEYDKADMTLFYQLNGYVYNCIK